MSEKVFLTDRKIFDSWSVLIEKANGKSEEVFEATKRLIQEADVPGIEMNMVAGRTRQQDKSKFFALGAHYLERDYLRVTNENLKDFKMYIGARDYGNNLSVFWYLTCEPSFLDKLVSGFFTKDVRAFSFALDIFQQEDLTSYVTCVHHCLLKAVDQLMQSLNQDPSEIDRKSKGFLGVS